MLMQFSLLLTKCLRNVRQRGASFMNEYKRDNVMTIPLAIVTVDARRAKLSIVYDSACANFPARGLFCPFKRDDKRKRIQGRKNRRGDDRRVVFASSRCAAQRERGCFIRNHSFIPWEYIRLSRSHPFWMDASRPIVYPNHLTWSEWSIIEIFLLFQ